MDRPVRNNQDDLRGSLNRAQQFNFPETTSRK